MVLCPQCPVSLLQAPLLLHAHHGFPDHDVQRDIPSAPLKVDLPRLFEAKLSVNRRVRGVARLQVARPAFAVRKLRYMLNEFTSVTFATTTGPSTEVNKVPGVMLSLTKRGVHSVVEEGHEFVEEAPFPFSGEAVVEAPHARAKHS